MTLLAAFLAGFAVLVLEILGVHLASAWFGASSVIWTHQIGVVLLALALGGWLGGRAAGRTERPAALAGWLLLGGGGLLGLAVALLPLYAEWVLPEELELEQAAGLFLGGSLGGALLFYAPPVLLLAMVSPLLVQERSRTHGAGAAAGQLYAAGTLGSLLGTFGSTWLFLPAWGVRATLAGTALALALAGLLLARPRRRGAALLFFLPGLGALLLPDRAAAANLPAAEGLEVRVLPGSVRETPYGRLRILEFRRGEEIVERRLQMNEGLDSFQSLWPAGFGEEPRWTGAYYDLFALALFYAGEAGPGRAPEAGAATEVWCLGFGAGSLLGPLARALGERPWRATGVELDPAVVELGERFLPLPPGLRERTRILAGLDARTALRGAPRDLDLLFLDAYARQFEIPLHLATVEFFEECRERLRPGGVLALNLGSAGGLTSGDPVLRKLRASLGRAFGGRVRAQQVPGSRNLLLFARKDRPLAPQEELAGILPAGLPLALGGACLPLQVLDGPPEGGGEILRDDRSSLALDQARAWWGGRR